MTQAQDLLLQTILDGLVRHGIDHRSEKVGSDVIVRCTNGSGEVRFIIDPTGQAKLDATGMTRSTGDKGGPTVEAMVLRFENYPAFQRRPDGSWFFPRKVKVKGWYCRPAAADGDAPGTA